MNPVSTPVQPVTDSLKKLTNLGQSIWLDYIRRSLIDSGDLKRLIDGSELRGMTSNPAIFEKAIADSTEYQQALASLQSRKELTAMQIYETLAVRDIQDAADALNTVYRSTHGRDGFVSLEVSPYLARDTRHTIDEAMRLWKTVGRENLMIKVPATREGLGAIEELISRGINVNITLIFSNDVYKQVVEAFIAGLEKRSAKGEPIDKIASVASFFVSRIDTAVDAILAKKIAAEKDPKKRRRLQGLLGRAAIANAKLAYQIYKGIIRGARWKKLAAKGAHTQRLLWASTSTKNPDYRDVMYIEELIGPDTVNTVPPATLDAFREHGRARPSLEENIAGAEKVMKDLKAAGISMKQVTDKVLEDGIRLFVEPFDKLLNSVDKMCRFPVPSSINQQTYRFPADLSAKVQAEIGKWKLAGKMRRLWSRDPALWTGTDEGQWLGWLGIVEDQLARVSVLEALQEEVKKEGFSHALLLGMGGSSLCPEVLAMTFGHIEGFPELHVLDSTDPGQVLAFEKKVDLSKTLFIVSSKSGSTLEPNIFQQYFWDRVVKTVGEAQAGRRFIAITDPGSKLEKVAKSLSFRGIFYGLPSIGGRYSALSDFGMVPAAVMGLDVSRLLDHAQQMAIACSACKPVEQNPGAILGILLGLAARSGRDKITLIASPGIHDLGAWLEQLLAESTGKDGAGLIPVDREPQAEPKTYGKDRLFVYLRLTTAPDISQDQRVAVLEEAGHPVVRIEVAEPYDIGQEMFRWEIATAVAGSVLGINAFNQPDVEASKIETRKLTDEYERTGALPPEKPILEDKGIRLFADDKNAKALAKTAGKNKSLVGYLKAHLGRLKTGDYFAVLAYIPMTQNHEGCLEQIRKAVLDKKHAATCLGFGPRFLHSTGQAYKGGPNSGVFLQITCDDAQDLPVPGRKFTFGVVKAAQARGDFAVLAQRSRRALRVHLGPSVEKGLAALQAAGNKALGG